MNPFLVLAEITPHAAVITIGIFLFSGFVAGYLVGSRNPLEKELTAVREEFDALHAKIEALGGRAIVPPPTSPPAGG